MQVIPQKNNLTDDIPTIPDIDDLADSTSKNILTPKYDKIYFSIT